MFIDKLIETLDIGNLSPYLLLSTDFPTGIKYHHDRPYMKGIELGIYKPYNFHMCWTLNKANKIDYFIKSNMWYINGNSINKDGDGGGNHDIGDKCALSSSYSKPSGTIYKEFISSSSSSSSIQDMMKKTNAFENKCCISNERKMWEEMRRDEKKWEEMRREVVFVWLNYKMIVEIEIMSECLNE